MLFIPSLEVGTLGGTNGTYGYGINDAGQITGAFQTTSDAYHAYGYSNGLFSDLGTLPGDYDSGVRGINNTG